MDRQTDTCHMYIHVHECIVHNTHTCLPNNPLTPPHTPLHTPTYVPSNILLPIGYLPQSPLFHDLDCPSAQQLTVQHLLHLGVGPLPKDLPLQVLATNYLCPHTGGLVDDVIVIISVSIGISVCVWRGGEGRGSVGQETVSSSTHPNVYVNVYIHTYKYIVPALVTAI